MLDIDLNNYNITDQEKESLRQVLALQNPKITDELEQIWYLMDKIWDDMGCDNHHLDWKKIGQYYSHPIWLLNGIFIENHTLSMIIREKIADYILEKKFKTICDYGGGFGTLAKSIAKKCPNSIVYIYEPHPSRYGLECIKEYNNIFFIDTLEENFYDCIISTDVLEHVEFPMQTFSSIIKSVKYYSKIEGGGELIIANCFYPCIKCHLPHNFHFRYTFNYFAQKMGLKKIGKIPQTHATIFQKKSQTNKYQISKTEILISKAIFYIIESIKPFLKAIYRCYKKIKK